MSAGAVIKFRTCGHGKPSIEPVACTRETDASVFIMRAVRGIRPSEEERRVAKRSEFEQYHNTWADARDYLLTRAESGVIAARRSLELAQAKLGNIKGMKPPAE